MLIEKYPQSTNVFPVVAAMKHKEMFPLVKGEKICQLLARDKSIW